MSKKASKAWKEGIKEHKPAQCLHAAGVAAASLKPKRRSCTSVSIAKKARLLQQAAGRNVSMLKLSPSFQCLLCLYLMWQYQTGNHVFFILLSMISKKLQKKKKGKTREKKNPQNKNALSIKLSWTGSELHCSSSRSTGTPEKDQRFKKKEKKRKANKNWNKRSSASEQGDEFIHLCWGSCTCSTL